MIQFLPIIIVAVATDKIAGSASELIVNPVPTNGYSIALEIIDCWMPQVCPLTSIGSITRENELMRPRARVVYVTLCPALGASVIENKKADSRITDLTPKGRRRGGLCG